MEKLKKYWSLISRIYRIHKNKLELPIIVGLFSILTSIYLFPVFQGLIILPLDLLVSSYTPWYSPGTILIKNPYMQDSIIQMFPWRHLVFQSLTHGIIPFWNPYQFMGAPFMASMKPLIFYPGNLLFIFGEVTSWNMLLFLQVLLSLYFFYLLMREFKISVVPSVLSALAFGLNTLMIGVLEFGSEGHVILWIPLFILFAKRYMDNGKGRYVFLLGFVILFSVFAGQLQYTGYGLIMLCIFVFAYGYHIKLSVRKFIILFLSIFVGLGMSSILLLPALELFSVSHRGLSSSPGVFLSGLMNPVDLLRLLSPDFFGSPVSRDAAIGYIETSGYFGIIPLFFCLYALFSVRRNFFVKFFSFVFIVCGLLSLNYIGSIIYYLRIPLITSGSGGRIFMLVLFSGSVLAGFGLFDFVTSENNRNKILSLLGFSLILASVFFIKALSLHNFGLVKQFVHDVNSTLIIFPAFFILAISYLFLKKRTSYADKLFMVLVVLLAFVELFRFGYRYLTFSNLKFLYPEMGVTKFVNDYSKDTLARSYGLSEPELPTFLNVYSVETYNPLYLLRNGNLMQSLQGLGNLSDDNKYFITRNGKLKDTFDFLGVSLIVDDKNRNPSIDYFQNGKYQGDFKLLYQDNRYKVYFNDTAFPRFYLAYQYEVINQDNLALAALQKSPESFRNIIILDQPLPINLNKGTGSAVLLSSDVNHQSFRINSDKPALFYISDTFYPGWSAKINNVPTKIYRANYNFRAVLVPAGESVLDFSYVPTNFGLGIIISIISLILLIIFGLFARKITNGNNIKNDKI